MALEDQRNKKLDRSFLPPLEEGRKITYNPPLGSIYHLYTTYILPIGWLYGTYHLLREPGNSIDKGITFFCFLVWIENLEILDVVPVQTQVRKKKKFQGNRSLKLETWGF